MANALTLRFGSDVDSAKAGIASLATSIASNLASVSGAALTTGRSVQSMVTGTISGFQSMSRAMSMVQASALPVAAGILIVAGAMKAMNAITDLAKERLEEYNKIAEQAAAGGVSTDFFQRTAKAADDAKISIDDAAAALKKFRDVSSPALGGSALDQRLDELRKAGNFKANTGVDQFKIASTDEERYRAMVSLITQALDKGERLAALDLAAKFLPPAMLDQLKANAGFLKEMQERADKLAATSIISPEDIARAVDLQARLDAASKTLSEKFKPIQDDLASLGLNYHENWVSIVEDLATAVKHATALYQALKQVPDWFAKRIGGASVWSSITEATTTPEGRAAAEKAHGITPIDSQPAIANSDSPEMTAAKNRLRTGLTNPADVRLAGEQTTNVAYGARQDTSKVPKPGTDKESLDQIETLISRMERANDVLKIELDTEGKSNVEKEKGIALAQAAAAARAAQRPLTDEERSNVLKLAEAHATLADRLKDVQQAQRAAAEASRYFGNLASDALGDMIVDGKSATEVANGLFKALAKAALQSAFTGQGPLASIFGTAPLASAGSNAVGGLAGMFTGLFRAGGGDVKAGQMYTVGELGREMFVPDQDGKIYPLGKGPGAGGFNFAPVFQVDATGADSAAVARLFAGIAAVNNGLEQRALAAYREDQRRRG